jgi:hypothetical protein
MIAMHLMGIAIERQKAWRGFRSRFAFTSQLQVI